MSKPAMLSAPPVGPDNKARAQKLAAKKRLALLTLLFACGCFVGLTVYDPDHQSWWVGLFVAMAEAAMIGGLADWFAIVALFRHPLGLKIPHTAIIPRSKDKIARNLADFICDHFLGKDHVLEKIREFDPADRLAKYCANPQTSAQMADLVVKFAPRLMYLLDSAELQEFVRTTTREKLREADVGKLSARFITILTQDGRHHEMVDSLLNDIADFTNSDETRNMLADKIAGELWSVLRWVNLDKAVADNITEKVAVGLRELIQDLADNKDHELRLKFENKIPVFIDRLQTDPVLRARLDQFRDRMLDNQELSDYIAHIWRKTLNWLRSDLANPQSEIRRAIIGASQNIGTKLDADPDMKNWLNLWVLETVDPYIGEYREKIRHFIKERVQAWSADELTAQLELAMGSDLQSIRLNGTLVGALIGGVLFATMQFIGWLTVQF
ncbi:DUF445 domain-containing protein [Thalassospira profundimaris]|uniref:DUF445 domain-containing protein n=1 Tax=Thalassospira profundimaris TaxID=502049 RepID=UPI000DEDFEDB|nr:DUF445 domain-containing protein [Thalassospira profundimaris]